MNKDVIIALDFDSFEETKAFVDQFDGIEIFVKVGMELFYSCGVDVIKYLKSKNCKIFLDLKLHDIPNTVYKSLLVLDKLGVDIINVHALGGFDMLLKAKEACQNSKIIAVTILTSMDDVSQIGVDKEVKEEALLLAKLCNEANLDGVVCSPLEAGEIKRLFPNLLTVTPGIRLDNDEVNDQKRVVNPALARELGSDLIVVGRSITNSDSPAKVYKKIKGDFLR